MKSQLLFASITHRTCLVVFLFGALPLAACDHSNSVGKIGESSSAVGSPAGSDGGVLRAGGATASGAAGTVGGGTTAPAGGVSAGAGKGGGAVSGQAGASGGGKGGAAGSSAMDAGVDRYQCPLTNIYCPDGYTTDAYGCTVCAAGGTGGGGGGGTTAKGGAGGTRADAAADGHVCPPLTDVYCPDYVTDAYGCTVCASSGTGGIVGGTSSKGGTGGTTGTAGASGSGGKTAATCQRRPEDDSVCRALDYPPLAVSCGVPAQPPSNACKSYGMDSGFYCCPDQSVACPDSPPTNGTACTGAVVCSYGSHPDPTCRTAATCENGTWKVNGLPSTSKCFDPQLPATCPASPTAGAACSSPDLNCYYTNGTFCLCTNCSIEESAAFCGTANTWHCWTPPGGDCPTYYPNLGTTCALPANTSCRYTCAARTSCSAGGMWVDLGNLCPN